MAMSKDDTDQAFIEWHRGVSIHPGLGQMVSDIKSDPPLPLGFVPALRRKLGYAAVWHEPRVGTQH